METETLECLSCKQQFISNGWTFFGDAGRCPECGGWLHLVAKVITQWVASGEIGKEREWMKDFMTLNQIKRNSKSIGLSYLEHLEMAYENLLQAYKGTNKIVKDLIKESRKRR